MATSNTPAVISLEPGTPRNMIIVTVDGQDMHMPMASYGITMESNPSDVLSAVSPAVLEQTGVDISSYYKVSKAVNSDNIYVIPASVAG